MRRHLNARREAVTDGQQDGLSLIEVMVALLMLSIVSVSAAVVFVGSLRTTTEQSAKQRAISVATRALENVQSVPVSQVLVGRRQADVQALNSSAEVAPLVAQDITSSNNYQADVLAGATPVIPLKFTEQLDGTDYVVRTAINRCYLSASAGSCRPTAGADGVETVRATVNVTWGDSTCRGCTYAVSALLDRQLDPVFRLAQSQPEIQGITPSSARTGSSQTITIAGAAFALGVRLELPPAAGTLTGLTRNSDGTRLTVTWVAGSAPGNFELAAVNPDEGRATFAITVTSPPAPPVTVGDCVATTYTYQGTDYYVVPLQQNDSPQTGGYLTYSHENLGGGARGEATVGGVLYAAYRAAGDGVFSVDYTNTVDGQTSNVSTITFRVNSGPC